MALDVAAILVGAGAAFAFLKGPIGCSKLPTNGSASVGCPISTSWWRPPTGRRSRRDRSRGISAGHRSATYERHFHHVPWPDPAMSSPSSFTAISAGSDIS